MYNDCLFFINLKQNCAFYFSISAVLKKTPFKSVPTSRMIGKIVPTRIPIFKLPPKISAINPTRVGPAEQPISPATANIANIAVPPPLMPAAPTLSVPGHIIPTEKPHIAKPIKDKIILFEKAVIR